ncbi:MAG: hypothetical protein BWY79_02019 [Actinobacteria bacterium ADurb.Bin444]|nr:MAG: hypothetical protein BWY79_02019 [Actinobacteria bacterium ADurb.Bin444]
MRLSPNGTNTFSWKNSIPSAPSFSLNQATAPVASSDPNWRLGYRRASSWVTRRERFASKKVGSVETSMEEVGVEIEMKTKARAAIITTVPVA